ALSRAPDSDMVLVAWAHFLSAAGDDDGATRAIDRAEARSPSCELLARASGEIRFRARRPQEAVHKFRQALALGPPHGVERAQWQQAITLQVLRVHAHTGAWGDAQADAVELMRLVGATPERMRAFAARPAREAVRD